MQDKFICGTEVLFSFKGMTKYVVKEVNMYFAFWLNVNMHASMPLPLPPKKMDLYFYKKQVFHTVHNKTKL
jgi:hypothetical protein